MIFAALLGARKKVPVWRVGRAQTWMRGHLWLGVLTLPLTIIQLQALFGFGPRPPRLDYLVLLWATVPWLWSHPGALARFDPRAWPASLGLLRRQTGAWLSGWTRDPGGASRRARVEIRAFLGLENRGTG